jgi:GT2 family glycosyltransferase
MVAFAGMLCLLAPLLVATDAPGPARLIVSLLFFSLVPGVAALSVTGRREAPLKLEAGMVVGTSLALSTLLAWLMLWLHAWQPQAALYSIAGVCLLTLAIGARLRSRVSSGGGDSPDAPRPNVEDEQRLPAPEAAKRPSKGRRLRTRLEPTWVSELELAAPIADLCLPAGPEVEYSAARILVRLHRQPLGFMVLAVNEGRLAAADILTGVREQLGEELERHLARDGLEGTPLLASGLPVSLRPSCSTSGPHPLESSFASVVVCTRDRADSLARTLRSLLALRHDSFEIVVVDNAPRTSATRELVRALGEQRIRYVLEAQPGLSRARNRGIAAARGEIVAFTDDDVVADSEWLSAIVRGFTRAESVGCVTGMVPAAELETQAQAYFDSKLDWAESCEARLFDLGEHRPQDDRTYPYSAGLFGAGANFALRKSVFTEVGGFDEALGVGSPSRGGEDLDYFLRIVLSGRIIAYEPAALVWHLHRRENDALVSQMYGYGTGLTAYVFKHLLFTPGVAVELLRKIPVSLARFARDNNHARRRVPAPRGALFNEARGLLAGPLLYTRARRRLGSHAAEKNTHA